MYHAPSGQAVGSLGSLALGSTLFTSTLRALAGPNWVQICLLPLGTPASFLPPCSAGHPTLRRREVKPRRARQI